MNESKKIPDFVKGQLCAICGLKEGTHIEYIDTDRGKWLLCDDCNSRMLD